MGIKPKVYLDTNCFIAMVKTSLGVSQTGKRENEAWYCKKLLEASRNGELLAFTSALTVAEALHVGDAKNVPEEAKILFKGILTSGKGGVVLVETSIFVISKARDLFWDDDIRIKAAPDRIHLASAIDIGCQEFYTTDRKDLISKSKKMKTKYGLTISYPSRTTILPKSYRQEGLELIDEEKKETRD